MFFLNKKGQSLLTVLVVASVLIILAAALSDAAFVDYTGSLADGKYSYSRFAAESAVEMCYDGLVNLCSINEFASKRSIYFTNANEFANSIIAYLNSHEISTMMGTDLFKNLRVSDNGNETAVTKSLYLQLSGTPVYTSPYVDIPVGLTAVATYKGAVGNPETSRVYAKRTLRVYASEPFKLRGAIYTLGDLVTSPSSITGITGDVYVYGTTPETMTSNQEYYGGIYAKQNSQLNIHGNAYSRSFIRTGDLEESNSNNIITIDKDAIAQGIQVFSNNSKIVVCRDAYTFDDLEMNGEDSVIAVNGNYFGLSKGKSFHDDSSAIVNSASIFSDSDAAMRSRIVINGDVLINGGTFRFDPDTNTTLGQIEDASTAWILSTPSAIIEKPLYEDWNGDADIAKFHMWLKIKGYGKNGVNSGLIRGYGNLFQVWDTKDMSQISGWLTAIKDASGVGTNDFSKTDKAPPASISGYANYELAANDKMYYCVDGINLLKKDNTSGLEIVKATNLFDNFNLDILNEDPAPTSTWKSYWNKAINTSTWDTDPNDNYLGLVSSNLTDLLGRLKGKAPFVSRTEYDSTNTAGTKILHQSNGQFELLCNKLKTVANNNQSCRNIISEYSSTYKIQGSGEWEIPNLGADANKMSLLINLDSTRTIVLDKIKNGDTFKGIIFSTGKVILRNGAKMQGAIIAAGQGYTDDSTSSYKSGSAADPYIVGPNGENYIRAPRIKSNGDNESVFKSGGYAGVLFEGAGNEVNFPGASGKTNPKDIRDYYIDQFINDDGVDLSGILN